jgi:Holliday junction resolvase RusA-like endonuclease
MKPRVKKSFGKYHINEGKSMCIPQDEPYKVDYDRQFYLFDIVPCAAPRMTQSDKWKTNPNHPDPRKRQRVAVERYFKFRDNIKTQSNLMKFELPDCFEVVFFVPMPDSWSQKKKERMNGLPCMVRPDTDNYVKAIKDSFKKEDNSVWMENAQKRYAYRGSILIYT